MSLLEEAAALAPRVGGRCAIAILLDKLPEVDRDRVVELLASAHSSRTVYNVLEAHEWTVPRQTIGRHRLRECKCPR